MTGAEVLVRDGIGIMMTVERGRESINNKKVQPRAAEVGDIVDFFRTSEAGIPLHTMHLRKSQRRATWSSA